MSCARDYLDAWLKAINVSLFGENPLNSFWERLGDSMQSCRRRDVPDNKESFHLLQ